MTNDELLHDLKQFITAAVSQSTSELATKEDLENLASKQDFTDLRSEMNEKFDAVDARFDEVLNAVGTELKEHEDTLTRLKRVVGHN